MRCDVVVAQSAVDGISDYAANGEVDLIMMYTHDRKGLTKMIKGSVAEKVSTKACIDVQVFKPSEVWPTYNQPHVPAESLRGLNSVHRPCPGTLRTGPVNRMDPPGRGGVGGRLGIGLESNPSASRLTFVTGGQGGRGKGWSTLN